MSVRHMSTVALEDHETSDPLDLELPVLESKL